MTKVIIYTKIDGTVTIVNPAPEFVVRFPNEDDAIAAIQAKDVLSNATDVKVVDKATILNDRWFRNAWAQTNGVISIDLPKAREIQSEKISRALGLEIARLKLSEQKARLAGRPSDATADAATRTALEILDLAVLATQIANAGNPNALKNIWPAQIPRP